MKDNLDVKKRIKDICNIPSAVKFVFTAFLLVSFLRLAIGEGKYIDISFGQSTSIVLFTLLVLSVAVGVAVLEVILGKYKAADWLMLASALAFSLLLIAEGDEKTQYPLYAAILVIFAVIINYLANNGTFDTVKETLDKRVKWSLIAVFAVLACSMVAAIGVYRYISYAAPNFDFGIWCNMFHNMKESGLPNTTCERDGLLSHFAVHFSPIYYVMLPFYMIFPSPITLQIFQAVILYSGIIPLCLMARDKALSDRTTVILALVYSFYPAIATGTFYDLHENCFLVPLLLWCFCFFEKGKQIPMWVFVGLTLLVKEDAFIYILIFAVYVFFVKKKKLTAIALALTAVIYFLAVSSLMEAFGNGIMVGRYDNLIANKEDGLYGVVKTVLLNPGYLLTQLFVSKDGDSMKVLYILQLVFTLGFIPFATKKISRYILAVPMLMNLITMYVYQPNIRFQYSFGITAFLFYATLLNLAELGERPKKVMLPFSAVASVLLFSMLVTGHLGYYVDRYDKEREKYRQMDSALEEVLPADASVVCSTFILPHIADRDEVYEISYHKENGRYKTDTEFAVLDMRYKDESGKAADFLLENGYEEFYSDGGYLLILKKK